MSESAAPGANAPEFSVSELSSALKRAIEDRFGYVRVRGEISGYRGPHSSGHVYFSLKDANARLDAVIWKGVFARMRVKPEEGLEVVATGKITTFPGKSAYQIVVESLEPAGVGALMALLEARRRKLAAEGLFDAARKQSLPYLPRVIGVVTSPTGAVIRDILHRLADRFPVHVLVWPVRVQGETSAAEVAQAIRGFNALPPDGAIPRPDLIIVARGGGSLEDLWSFNEEIVVRAAAESDIPLIAAVGHETDWTLIDHAADVRAPTPTAAAELSVPVRAELLANLADLDGRLPARGAAPCRAPARRAARARSRAAVGRSDPRHAAPAARFGAGGACARARAKLSTRARSPSRYLSRRLARQSPRARVAGMRERQRGLAQRLARAGGALAARPRQALRQAASDFSREARRERRAREERLAAAARRLGALTLVEGRRAGERSRTLAQIEARLRRAFAKAQRRRLTRLAAAAQVLDRGQLSQRAGARLRPGSRRRRRAAAPRRRDRAPSAAAHRIRRRRDRRDRRRGPRRDAGAARQDAGAQGRAGLAVLTNGGRRSSRKGGKGRLEPRMRGGGLFFVGGDGGGLDHGQADVVEPFHQAMLAEGVDLELDDAAVGAADFLRREIDRQRRVGAAPRVVHQFLQIVRRNLDRQNAVLEAIVVENVGEVGRDHAADAEIEQRPGRVLARGAAAEIVAGDEDLGVRDRRAC